ncbi:hypothetical protein IAT38_001024 [Cryptococcus sp. DSM 104549]
MAAPATSPQILLFARGTLALLDLWPALTIAVAEEWGGTESAEKKTWIASTIIDEFESRASYLPPAPGATAAEGLIVDPASAGDPPLDVDQLGDLLQQIMEDEFEARLEDGSIDSVSADLIRLWRDVVGDAAKGPELVRALEGKADEVKKSGVKASKQAGADGDDSSDESGDEDEDMEVDGEEAPQLEPREREHQEPVVDDDGFTLVQKPRRR